MRKRLYLAISALITCGLPLMMMGSAHHALAQILASTATPENLFAEATHIVYAECIRNAVVEHNGLPYTEFEYRVIEPYQGTLEINQQFKIGFLGGAGKNLSGRLRNAPNPNVGDRAILLLAPPNKKNYYILKGYYMGFIPLKKYTTGYRVPPNYLKRLPKSFTHESTSAITPALIKARTRAFLKERAPQP